MNTLQIFATVDYGEVVNFSSVRLYGLETNTHSLNGTYTVIDSNEFLALVTACMAINDQYQIVTDSDPYDFLTARFNDSTSQDYIVVAFRTGSYDIRPQLTANAQYYNNLNINGVNIDPSTQTYFVLTNTNCIFDDSLTISNVGTHGDTFLIAKNDADRVLCFDVGTQPVMSSILSRLTSIRDNVNSIATYMPSITNILTNIYTGVNSMTSNVSSINALLGGISTKLTSINNTCNSLLTAEQAIEADLDSYLPDFDNYLDSIDSELQVFYNNFTTYASSVLTQMQDANDTLSSINSNLDDMMDMMNGTALQNVQVPGAGINLWSLIKNSVSTSINGLGSFFRTIFTAIGWFVTPAMSAFDDFGNISNYESVPYNPGFRVVIPGNFGQQTLTTGKVTITTDNTLVIIEQSEYVGNSSYSQTTIGSVYLEPGQYTLSDAGTSSQFPRIQIKKGSNLYRAGNGSFTITTAGTYNYSVYMKSVTSGYLGPWMFSPTITREGS